MDLQSVQQWSFDFFAQKPVVVEPSRAELTSDAGLLPIRQFDERIGLTEQFAAVLDDPRDAETSKHSYLEMVRMRVYGILADYPDQNDHDTLGADPVFKLIAGRSPDAGKLASQPTLSRFENAISPRSLLRLEELEVAQFVAAFSQAPRRLTLDMDTYDDPTYGDQQLTFWHDYYKQYQYQVRTITCAENDLVASSALLYGSAHVALGAADDLRRVVGALRARFPDVQIRFRADNAFGVPKVLDACEELGIDYDLGVKMNPVLKTQSDPLLEDLRAGQQQTGQPQRDAVIFAYRAKSWSHPRQCIVRVEVTEDDSNRRAILTTRRGAAHYPLASYDEYADRGESENRNKELKRGLWGDRLSDHRYMANNFRLHMHVAAHNLLVRLRHQVADPPADDPGVEVPREALPAGERRRYFNQRRLRDPLGEGHPCTWRTRLIKVAAEVIVSARRILVRLSASWPYLGHYAQVAQAVLTQAGPAPLESG